MFNLGKLSVSLIRTKPLNTLLRVTNYSTARPTVIVRTPTLESESTNDSSENVADIKPKQTFQQVNEIKSGGLVAAAFASLQAEDIINSGKLQKPSFTEKRIAKATTVNELLAISEDNGISRQHALKIVSVLAQWSTSGEIKLSDFETDPRFVKLCRILSRGSLNKARFPPRNVPRGDDLSMVLGVTGDDEAAKLVGSITLPQMIKVMSTLAQKKRRSTPLLRSLAYNISRNATKLDLKQCADLLYSMTILNFPESVLLERISNDVCEGLEANTDRSAVVGSLLTSIGLLRYKEIGCLDALSEWMLKNYSICRPQDVTALFLTLAVLNHQPSNAENLYKVLIPQLTIADVPKAAAWLDFVWSLVLLNRATNEHISSVLKPDFLTILQSGATAISTSAKIKLLNINAAAKLLRTDYVGPNIETNSPVNSVAIARTKEKQVMVSAMLDSLGSLLSSSHLRSNVNTGMGFLIDGECVIDKKCNPLPLSAESSQSADRIRVAILAYDYHDMCRGFTSPHGANIFAANLLEAQGYKLMIVPYTDFNPRDKLVQRVRYLEKQLKSIAGSAP